MFDEDFKTIERGIPLGREAFQALASGVEWRGLKLPNTLASQARTAGKPGVGEYMQMFGHGLARNGGVARQAGDRHRSGGGQARHDTQTRFVAESGEDRRRLPGARPSC